VPTRLSTLSEHSFALVPAALPATVQRRHFTWIQEILDRFGTVAAKVVQGVVLLPDPTHIQIG
jgi:hypothetical protein